MTTNGIQGNLNFLSFFQIGSRYDGPPPYHYGGAAGVGGDFLPLSPRDPPPKPPQHFRRRGSVREVPHC